MAAKIAGCKEIIAIDRVPHRLETAKELGATKIFDTTNASATFSEDVQKLVDGQRISVVIETTGAAPVINETIKALGRHGKYIQLGVYRLSAKSPCLCSSSSATTNPSSATTWAIRLARSGSQR